jgi:hypothetical protein
MTFLARSSLFVAWSSSLAMIFAFGCDVGTTGKPTSSQQVQQLTAQKTDLQAQLEQSKIENDRLKKQAESLSKLPGDKRADAIYHLKSIKIGRYTNFYDEDKTPGATGKKNLVVYVEPIDEMGDVIKAAGTIDVQLWDLNKKESEARLAQWQIEPNELKKLWLDGMLSSSYRLSFDAAGIVDKFDKPLTIKVNFTDYLSGMTFTEQLIIRPPRSVAKP